MNDHPDDLQRAIEHTRAEGHSIEQDLKTEGRTVTLTGRKLHHAIARAGEYQQTEVTKNYALLEEIRTRGRYYSKLRNDIDNVIKENARQERVVIAAVKGAIAGQAALDAELVATGED